MYKYIFIYFQLLLLTLNSHFNYANQAASEGLPLYYWTQKQFVNFGDYLSLKLVERIVGGPVRSNPSGKEKKLLAVGSIFYFARENDVVWGSGINGKKLEKNDYTFKNLDIRAVRGPLSREFIIRNFNIECPEVYGDPALLMPFLFPEFKRKENPKYSYIVIAHYLDEKILPKADDGHIVYATDPWEQIIDKILDSAFVVSSSLHGVIIAEAYGIPARLLRVSQQEPVFKFLDYYMGTGRQEFHFASSVNEALEMGGEPPFVCDLQKLYDAFPFEFWPKSNFLKLTFD